ncbi:MAG: hypothetical protein SOY42_09390 [Clostridium sp.]|nr:hypothetical protein [Clostridium sp.]
MKKFTLLFILLSIFMIGCGEKALQEKIDKGYSLLEEKNYDNALSTFNDILKKEENNDIKNLCNIIENYLNAKKEFDNNDFDKALKKLEKINESYKNYSSLNEDIETLKRECNKKLEDIASINSDLTDLETFIKEERYGACSIIIDELEKLDLSHEQIEKFKALKEELQSKTSNSSKTETNSTDSKSDILKKIIGTWICNSSKDTLTIDYEYINFYKYKIKNINKNYIRLEVIYNNNVTSDVLIQVLSDDKIRYYTKFDNDSNKFIEPSEYIKQ